MVNEGDPKGAAAREFGEADARKSRIARKLQ